MSVTSGIGTCWGRVSRRRGVVMLAGALLLTAPLASADAGTQTLCRGYADCRAAGYSDAGYEANSQRSYWRMFAGANCTNYVAYRLVRDGLADERPAADPGQSNASLNAFVWGVAFASLTNTVPKVGSVAWWGTGAGKGSIGHVAYVEKVHRDGAITISEDSSSGNGFAWKKLTPGQGWPQGFIHFGASSTRPLPVPLAPDLPDPRPRMPADKIEQGVLGGEWAGGIPWTGGTLPGADPYGTDPSRFSPKPVERDRAVVVKPGRSKAKKKAGKRSNRHERPMPVGGEVSGALGGMNGWGGTWGSAPR